MSESPTSAKPVKTQNSPSKINIPLAERAYIDIKRMILSHELQPGSHVNVAHLSEHLNLGRNPIHMAIHRLDREGLVEILPRKGILVKAETLSSFLELIQARLLIEPYLAGLACEQITREQLQTLQALVQTSQVCQKQNDRTGAMDVDRLFHRTLYQAANNHILADFAEQLLDRSLLFWFRPQPDRNETHNTEDLEKLYASVASGDKDSTVQAMVDHISEIKKKWLSQT